MINLCVPTLNRYDLLLDLINSSLQGDVVPDKFYIVDNGNRLMSYLQQGYSRELSNFFFKNVKLYTPGINLGVAASWNIFLREVGEHRIISNDDIVFGTDALSAITSVGEGFVFTSGIESINMFSLYCIYDDVVNTIGYFDETLSPNYGYFEDNDYSHRMSLAGISPVSVACTAEHKGSQTIKKFNDIEISTHHKKFKIAQDNYIRKWGGRPGEEKFTREYKE